MGKTGKWLKSLLTGKKADKDKEKDHHNTKPTKGKTVISPPPPKEKRRWSFRRPSESRKELHLPDQSLASTSAHGFLETRVDPDRHAAAQAAQAAVQAVQAGAQAAGVVVRLAGGRRRSEEEWAALRIQAVFRSYLARKALCALKGLVKLQALIRADLVRRQATETLRCMQALVAVQARARLQRVHMLEADEEERRRECRTPQRQRSVRNSPQHPRLIHAQDNNSAEENVKIVEVDIGSNRPQTPTQIRSVSASKSRHDQIRSGATTPRKPTVSPSPSALTETSPRTHSGHFDEFSFTTAQSGGCSPMGCGGGYYASYAAKSPFGAIQDYPLFPNYMANTQSSRAKARSQSAPKQRPLDSFERQSSARRASLETRNTNIIPKLGVRMQRSASQVGPVVGGNVFRYPWAVRLDKSSASLKESECGSTSTVVTNTSYYSTILAQEVHVRR